MHPERGIYVLDPDLGYRPAPGGRRFDERGVRHHGYPPGKTGARRLLFIGDSVTHRGRIVEGLRRAYGETDYEYWNAGVEGYNAVQVSGYHRRHLTDVSEDHVILTFHLNDFSVTPITFLDGDRLVLVRSGMPDIRVHAGLFHRSYLYRLLLALRAARFTSDERLDGQTADVRGALAIVRDTARGRGADLTVLILPWFAPPETWDDGVHRRHENVMAILDELGIRHFDLLPVLRDALAEGRGVLDLVDDPKHRLHPSLEFGTRTATFLMDEGFVP